MESEDIARVMDLMERHGLAEFEYESGTTHLRLNRDAETADMPQVDPAANKVLKPGLEKPGAITAPCVGWFLASHPATAAPTAFPRRAEKDEIVGYIRTGALLRPVLAERDCEILRALQSDGAGVGYGAALFATAP